MTVSRTGLAACALAGLLAAACGGSAGGPALPRSAAASATVQATAETTTPLTDSTTAGQPVSSTSRNVGNVYRAPLPNPQVAVTASRIYVAWQASPLGSTVRSELARIDPATGRVEAARRLGAQFQQAIAAGGMLWVAISTASGEKVLRLSPATLRLTGQWRLGSGRGQPYGAQVLAIAGGGLWADGGNRLVRLSLTTGRVLASIVLPAAASSDLSANAGGTVLIVGEADSGGSGAVQRRDPRTGALQASHAMVGVTAPVVAGPISSAVWVSEATGMMGYVQRLDTATLAPAGGACADGGNADTCLVGTNGIRAQLANGLLWITQPAGGEVRNYCGQASDGHTIAPVRLPRPTADDVLAIGLHWIFYAAPGPRASDYVRRAAMPAPCRRAAG